MGTVFVHDGRPDRADRSVDEQGYGQLLMQRRARRRLDIGDLVVLPDGSQWPVVSFRETFTALGWRQHVVAGVYEAPARSLSTPDLHEWLRAG